MVLESTMICIDNSEFMRNGDFSPTRLQCEQEAANYVAQCKLRGNPENAVGLLSMADNVKVLSTMTQEDRKLFCRLYEVEFEGKIQVIPAIKVAHLALKHRQNRNHKMRIVVFIGSPVEGVEKPDFIKLAKKLKKEKVSVDIICFGEASGEENVLMQEFVDTLNGKDGATSNLVVVSGGSALRDALANSPICRAEGGSGPAVNPAFDFGVDPDEDPELAQALRVSLEDQRLRQQQQETVAPAEMEIDAGERPAEGGPSSVEAAAQVDPAAMTEEEQLKYALQMSMQDAASASSGAAVKEEAMDVDAPGSSAGGLGPLVTDADALKQLMEDELGEEEEDKTKKVEKQ